MNLPVGARLFRGHVWFLPSGADNAMSGPAMYSKMRGPLRMTLQASSENVHCPERKDLHTSTSVLVKVVTCWRSGNACVVLQMLAALRCAWYDFREMF